jgi:hypothetical protein
VAVISPNLLRSRIVLVLRSKQHTPIRQPFSLLSILQRMEAGQWLVPSGGGPDRFSATLNNFSLEPVNCRPDSQLSLSLHIHTMPPRRAQLVQGPDPCAAAEVAHLALLACDTVESLPPSLTRCLSDLKELDAVLSGVSSSH